MCYDHDCLRPAAEDSVTVVTDGEMGATACLINVSGPG